MSSKTWHVRPLGAYRLACELRQHGYNVLVIDFFSKFLNEKKDLIDLLRQVISVDTKFVGYSSTFFSTDNQIKSDVNTYQDYYGSMTGSCWPVPTQSMFLLNRYIKKLSPQCKIFYGGANYHKGSEKILEDAGVDYVVSGLADGIIVDIVSKIYANQTIPHDLMYTGRLKIINLDPLGEKFNFPASSTIFHASDCISPQEVLPLETSRGCLFKCKFCSYPLLGRKKNDPKYHKFVHVVADEIAGNFENFGTTKYIIVDDTFNESTSKLQDLQQAIKHSGIDIEFSCYLRVDLLDRYTEQIKILYDMGMKSCFLGIETLNPESAKSVGKSINIERIKQTLTLARRIWGNEVSVFASFIVGLPFETEDTVNKWMSWVYDSADIIDGYHITPLFLTSQSSFPSEIGKNPKNFGYTVEKNKWINNKNLTQDKAISLSNQWMNYSWETGRLRPAGWEMLGMQNFGYDRKKLRNYKINSLPFAQFSSKYNQRFSTYKNQLQEYINKGIK